MFYRRDMIACCPLPESNQSGTRAHRGAHRAVFSLWTLCQVCQGAMDPALASVTWADLERISPVVWRRATRLAREFGYDY